MIRVASLSLLPLLVSAFLFVSCGSDKPGGGNAGAGGAQDSLDLAAAKEAKQLVKSFPSPMQLAQLLKRAGATYNGDLLNPQNRVTNYQTTPVRSMNLGVYSADMAYANVFEQKQEALKYLSAVRRLANDLGLEGVFDKDLENAVRRNENNQDSLVRIFSNTLADLKTRLHQNQQPQILNLMFAGGFIEGLYLALETYQDAPNPEIAQQIGEQKFNLEQLLEYTRPYKDEPEFAEVYSGLLQLQRVFAKVKENYSGPDEQATAQEDGVVTVGNDLKLEVTPEIIKELQNITLPLRQQIVAEAS